MILQSTILCYFKMSGYTENIRIAKKYILELFYKKLQLINSFLKNINKRFGGIASTPKYLFHLLFVNEVPHFISFMEMTQFFVVF